MEENEQQKSGLMSAVAKQGLKTLFNRLPPSIKIQIIAVIAAVCLGLIILIVLMGLSLGSSMDSDSGEEQPNGYIETGKEFSCITVTGGDKATYTDDCGRTRVCTVVNDPTKLTVTYENGIFYQPEEGICSGFPNSRGTGENGFNPYFLSMLKNFVNAASDAGYRIGIGGYWRAYCGPYGQFETAENKGVYSCGNGKGAFPGFSKHGWGLASDLNYYGNSSATRWAHSHAKEYGMWFPMCNGKLGTNECGEDWHIEPLNIEKRK